MILTPAWASVCRAGVEGPSALVLHWGEVFGVRVPSCNEKVFDELIVGDEVVVSKVQGIYFLISPGAH
ncbi:hypothetical protein [Arthrobacter sp. efr-133-R2A-120]|uniref:hypothetical protein n=1 Tax=Arthrobacter sp. efr-133-R2A-120 TaxID=3040277 RepID=UPI00254C7801|nr:hypothetical protein [Arthrobacter sp. efr-133-R2A-120]